MNTEHECKTLNLIFFNFNIKAFNMVQLMDDCDKDKIHKYICKHTKQYVKHFTPIENHFNENIWSVLMH